MFVFGTPSVSDPISHPASPATGVINYTEFIMMTRSKLGLEERKGSVNQSTADRMIDPKLKV